MEDRLLTPVEAARLLNMSRASVYIWIQKGIIKAVRLPTGKLRIPLSELDRMIHKANPQTTFYYTIFGKEAPKTGEG